MKPIKLSPTQLSLVEHMRGRDHPLVRYSGGYWTTEDCAPTIVGKAPKPWWGTETVRALQSRRVLLSENASAPFWKASFRLNENLIAHIPQK